MSDGTVCIADFGTMQSKSRAHRASRFQPGKVPKSDPGFFGTAEYLDPQVLAYQLPSKQSSDVYSLGILTWEVLTGKDMLPGHIIRDTEGTHIAGLVYHQGYRPDLAQLPNDLPNSEAVCALLQRCWNKRQSEVGTLCDLQWCSSIGPRPSASHFVAVIKAAYEVMAARSELRATLSTTPPIAVPPTAAADTATSSSCCCCFSCCFSCCRRPRANVDTGASSPRHWPSHPVSAEAAASSAATAARLPQPATTPLAGGGSGSSTSSLPSSAGGIALRTVAVTSTTSSSSSSLAAASTGLSKGSALPPSVPSSKLPAATPAATSSASSASPTSSRSPSLAASQSDMGAWHCSYCAYSNDASSAQACIICSTPRNAFDVQSELLRATWVCNVCTLRNENGQGSCYLCQTPKGSSQLPVARVAMTPPPPGSYVCSGCTVFVKESEARCPLCETPKA